MHNDKPSITKLVKDENNLCYLTPIQKAKANKLTIKTTRKSSETRDNLQNKDDCKNSSSNFKITTTKSTNGNNYDYINSNEIARKYEKNQEKNISNNNSTLLQVNYDTDKVKECKLNKLIFLARNSFSLNNYNIDMTKFLPYSENEWKNIIKNRINYDYEKLILSIKCGLPDNM